MATKDKFESGYSVIELAVVVLIAGIIMSFSVIMFGKGKARYQLTQKAQSLNWEIERARSLAVKYNQTLTLGFTSGNSIFGLTCASCSEPKNELPAVSVPTDVSLSAYPTMTIRGNGTISTTSGTIVVSDSQGRQVTISISNSGRSSVGELTEATRDH